MRASVLLAGLLVGACAGAPPERLDADAAAYQAGEPSVILDAVGLAAPDSTGPSAAIDVLVGVAPAGLVFGVGADSLEAIVRWRISVEREGGAPIRATAADTVRAATVDEGRALAPVWHRERFRVAPGRYTVRALLDDEATGRTVERRATVLARAASGRPRLGAMRLALAGRPVDAASVPAGRDSLVAVLQAVDLTPGELTLTVARVRADSLAAAPVDASTPFVGSLTARGIDASALDTLASVRAPARGTGMVSVPLPPLPPGVYRLTAEADGAAASRLVVARRDDYPRLTRLGDLVGPLAYLASDAEIAPVREARTEGARRRAFDRFWGEEIDDRLLASATVRAFYERVEEANRLFGGAKDGWKTDPGMVYILFGPPRFVESRLDSERWTYGAGVSGPIAFTFRRTSVGGPFRVLTLDRQQSLVEPVARARRQWRRGIVP